MQGNFVKNKEILSSWQGNYFLGVEALIQTPNGTREQIKQTRAKHVL
jgi:hypothetical protein